MTPVFVSPRRVAPPTPLTSLALCLTVSTLAACARTTVVQTAPPAPRITTGAAVLQAMHDRYATTWYRTLTFRQLTTQVPPGGGAERTTTWYETMMVPGRLRIDTDLARGGGQLFANDSQYVVVNNAVRRAAAGHNPLLVFGFDVYAQAPARTAQVLASLGFPDGPVREGTWLDRPVWIVGGGPTDLHSPQYWIDRERLVFVRSLQPSPSDTSKTYDVRFLDYRPAGGGWIAPRVEAYVGGQKILTEVYEDVRVDPAVSEALFDPKRWGTAPHWAKGSR